MQRLSHNLCIETRRHKHALSRPSIFLKNPLRVEERKSNNLHDPIPVVPGGHPEEREESHAKVVKGSVATETLARVLVWALWKRMKGILDPVSVGDEDKGEEERELRAD